MMPKPFSRTYNIKALSETQSIAQAVAKQTKSPTVIYLEGEIGSGKTTWAQFFLQALGVGEAVVSPTFTLIESYETTKGLVHHIDLYRLETEEEGYHLGLDDLPGPAIWLIEWPQNGRLYCPEPDLTVFLHQNGHQRDLTLIEH